MDAQTKQEVLDLIRYKAQFADNPVTRRRMWSLYSRVLGTTKLNEQIAAVFGFERVRSKNWAIVPVLGLGFLCAFVLDVLTR